MVELLVVLTIISVLSGLLFSGVARIQGASKGVKCQSNLRQFGMAGIAYAQDHEGVLVSAFSTAGASAFITGQWWFENPDFLSMLGQATSPTGAQIHADRNSGAYRRDFFLLCPLSKAVPGQYDPMSGSYGININLVGSPVSSSAGSTGRVLLGAIGHPTQVILWSDALSFGATVWYWGGDVYVGSSQEGTVVNGNAAAYRHGMRCQAVHADGHVEGWRKTDLYNGSYANADVDNGHWR